MARRNFLINCVFIFAFATAANGQRVYAPNSVLSSGTWYKIAVKQEGIYKIDLPFLNSLGIPTSNISSSAIRVFGNGGAMLDENNAVSRPDDLLENAIEVLDGGDGIFNGNDYFLFYAAGPDHWLKDSIHQQFKHQKNLCSDSSYYFISIGGTGKRIQNKSLNATANISVNSFNERYFYENDLVNFLNSGKQWLGEEFSTTNGNSISRNFNIDFTGLITTQPLTLALSLAGRSVGAASSFDVSVNNQAVANINVGAVSGYFLDAYATAVTQQNNFTATQSAINIALKFNAGISGAQGWLDWFELHGRKSLSMNTQSRIFFRDWLSVANGNMASYSIANTNSSTEIWELTNPLEPQKMQTSFTNNQTVFVNDASQLREYVAFNNANFLTPIVVGKMDNQNLHQSKRSDLIIITHPSFLTEANRLAAFHVQHDGDAVTVATTDKIYNEFSSGIPDPAALRDFVKMFYDKAGTDSTQQPKYLLLLGAASYDYKNRIANNSNWVPCYESDNSVDPLSTYTSDDFFGLLNDGDDVHAVAPPSQLDIGIGRLPARTLTEAKTMVDKIIHYHAAATLGPWRNQMMYVADDKDNGLHVTDAETVSADAAKTNALFDQTKIYLDAYKMISGGGGTRYPDVNAAIVNHIFDGSLLFNYNGHGGYQQLSAAAVLTNTELNQFNNPDKLPLFITATCDFAPFDDPSKNSLGGSLLYADSAGAIALMTTTRVVFASSNLVLNDNYMKIALQPDANGKYLTLGEAVKRTKNYTYQTYSDVYNNRKFVLLGDPAMKLSFPELSVKLSSINNQNITGTDTLKALNKYVFTGNVLDTKGNIKSDFNGTLYTTVYDKPQTVSTLSNDPASPVIPFQTQSNVLYKGRSTVNNGVFSFTFIVPKDISYQAGKGRISLYADNGVTDAGGVSNSFYIGGAGNSAATDTAGPKIQPFMNDTTFKNGGLTDEHPLLLFNLFDSSGINTVGTGIGHDITAIIDGDEKNILVLNSFYSAAANSYQQGQVIYQLPVLTEGKHFIQIKAWDVADHSGEARIDFVVRNKNKLQIEHVFNFPNPFQSTTHFSFAHNQPGIDLDVSIGIYDVSGKLVHQLKKTIHTEGTRVASIPWDGCNESGRKMEKGMYFFRIIVSSINGVATAAQKLILL